MPSAAARVRKVLDVPLKPMTEEDLERIRTGAKDKPKMGRHPYYSEAERIARMDAAVEKYKFKSRNKFMDAAIDQLIATLEDRFPHGSKASKK